MWCLFTIESQYCLVIIRSLYGSLPLQAKQHWNAGWLSDCIAHSQRYLLPTCIAISGHYLYSAQIWITHQYLDCP